jgi:hypothetical protein
MTLAEKEKGGRENAPMRPQLPEKISTCNSIRDAPKKQSRGESFANKPPKPNFLRHLNKNKMHPQP